MNLLVIDSITSTLFSVKVYLGVRRLLVKIRMRAISLELSISSVSTQRKKCLRINCWECLMISVVRIQKSIIRGFKNSYSNTFLYDTKIIISQNEIKNKPKTK